MVLRCLLCLTTLSRVNVQLTLVRFRWIPYRWFTKLLNKTKLPLAQHAQNSKHVDTLSMNEGPQVHLFCQSKSGFVHSFVVRSSFLAIQTRKNFDSQTPLHWYSLKIGWLNQALLSSGWVIWVWINSEGVVILTNCLFTCLLTKDLCHQSSIKGECSKRLNNQFACKHQNNN